MATYEITTKDGKVYEVDVPEPASSGVQEPSLATLNQASRDLATEGGGNFAEYVRGMPRTVAKGVDAAAFGLIPDAPINRLPQGPIPDWVPQVAGFAAGGPGFAALKAGRGVRAAIPALAKATLPRQTAIAALEGGVAGGLSDISHPSEIPMRTAAGAVMAAPIPAAFRGVQAAFRGPRQTMTTEGLLATPSQKVGKLPPSIRDIYIRERRTQLSQQLQAGRGELTASTQTAKAELNRLDRETLSHLSGETERVTKLLKDEAYQVALRLKTTDVKPLLTQQSTRQGDLVRSAIQEISDRVPLIPAQKVTAAIEKRFANNAKAYNLAYDQLQLARIRDEFGQEVPLAFTPGQLVNEVDRLGLGVKRSPTDTYSFADHTADELRDVLLDVIDEAASAAKLPTGKIRQAKAEWAKWKPVQKRLVQGTRLFEQSETVTDAFVSKLMQYARTDRTMNNEKYFSEIASYVGRDFAAPMRPIVEKLTAIEREQVAMGLAKAAELERIGIQAQGVRAQLLQQAQAGKRSITDLEIALAEKAERAKKFWEVLGKIGIVGGGVYGVNELRKLAR